MTSRVLLVLVVALLCAECCVTATIPRNFDPRSNEEMVTMPKKRPFCNAFTGCGRKRSQTAPGMPNQDLMRQRQYVDEDTLGTMLDSESAIDELSRQILSEAKLWEAIQEASAEIARRKQKEFYNSQ
ncbi:crustacean cardioactive peptide precursor [Bombyx mori]|uniref:Crustacean cardioactive peptide n=2 Tax=Bombyx TaxID=7090 RepID=B3IUE1_BOMMO|nr:crustacean cardioactive peptide precursor [Bombyx mori]BAG50376.1 crustacean cardioactive peptide [Bombyx mori]